MHFYAVTADGTVVPVQPLIQPLFGGLTDLEFLARLAGESPASPYEIVRQTFGGTEENWKKFLFDGFRAGLVRESESIKFNAAIPTVPSSLSPPITLK